MAVLSPVVPCVTPVAPTSPCTTTNYAELLARLLRLESDVCILAERDALLNTFKWEVVDFPALQTSPGAPGQIAVNGDNIAIYVEGKGWRFGVLTDTILPS